MKRETELPRPGSRAVRLTMAYVGSRVQLVSRQAVEMLPPPSDALRAQEGQAGFWYELRDAENRPLYRRVIQNPIRFAVEVRSDDPERPLAWQKVSDPRGTFVLLAPDLAQARTLVLFSSPLEPEAAAQPAKEMVRFDLTQHPEGGEVVR